MWLEALVVPGTGLEPASPKAADFKSAMFTNFITPARARILTSPTEIRQLGIMGYALTVRVNGDRSMLENLDRIALSLDAIETAARDVAMHSPQNAQALYTALMEIRNAIALVAQEVVRLEHEIHGHNPSGNGQS